MDQVQNLGCLTIVVLRRQVLHLGQQRVQHVSLVLHVIERVYQLPVVLHLVLDVLLELPDQVVDLHLLRQVHLHELAAVDLGLAEFEELSVWNQVRTHLNVTTVVLFFKSLLPLLVALVRAHRERAIFRGVREHPLQESHVVLELAFAQPVDGHDLLDAELGEGVVEHLGGGGIEP